MIQNTKNEILNYCMKKTIDSDMRNISQFSANVLSKNLNISRSLASQYLNSFVKERVLVKICSRPVYFLYKKGIEDQFQVNLEDNEYYSMEEFICTLSKKTHIKKNFMKMVGYDNSLIKVIDQVKSALKYPNDGLPVLLYGEKGVGKSLLCKEMFEYSIEDGIFNVESKLLKLKIFPDSKNVLKTIVGSELQKGLLELCNGGIVFIQQAQCLNLDVQQALVRIIDRGVYRHIDGGKEIKLKARIVLSVDEDYKKCLNYDFVQCFPMTCYIPSFKERYLEEKEELIYYFFKQHTLKLNRRILVSKTAIKLLATQVYSQNMDELKNIIGDICARANASDFDITKSEIYVKLFDLPEQILHNYGDECFNEEKMDYIDILAHKKSNESEKIIELFDVLLNLYAKRNIVNEHLINDSIEELTQYYKVLSCQDSYIFHQAKGLENRINCVIDKVLATYSITLPYNFSSLLSYCLYLMKSTNDKLYQWCKVHEKDIQIYLNVLEKKSPSNKLIMEKISHLIKNNLEIEFDNMHKIILLINLNYFNNSVNRGKYLCFIIAHGHSTASSMSETVNTILGSHVFEAFDMPLTTSMIDVAERLKKYIDRYTIKDDILLLVDMGSLEQLDEYLNLIDNKNIGIINNVSTKLALDVGSMVLNSLDMETVLKRGVENSLSKYTLVENEIQKDLVIFLSDNGIKMANRMKSLFTDNLPKAIDVDIISLDQNDFLNSEYMNGIHKEYNILFISGTCSSMKRPELFVSLEEIIVNIDIIRNYLNKYLSFDEMEIFSQNLIHSFSLENVVDNLSILDAKKLLSFIEETVNQMQSQLNRRFYGSTTMGLYIHMCCMVERLVTKEPIKNRINLSQFVIEHAEFIEIVKKCFSKTCQHYGIEIEDSEISYLYDYINEDEEKERNER